MAASEEDKGSIMSILATDLPLTSRQLKRILKRTGVGIARTGGYTGHGSGEVMIGFTTANRIRKVGLDRFNLTIPRHKKNTNKRLAIENINARNNHVVFYS